MKGPTRINWKGEVESRGDVAVRIPQAGDVALVRRAGVDRWLVFRCPCECGDQLPINLDERAGPSWRLYRAGAGMTLYPSVWRETSCESHFIVSHGRLWLLRPDFWRDVDTDEKLIAAVYAQLTDAFEPYADLADQIAAEPWDVLDACRVLVRRGQAREGRSRERGTFSRRGAVTTE